MADRLLLESGAPDGYLLEDSSGVVLLERIKVALSGTVCVVERLRSTSLTLAYRATSVRAVERLRGATLTGKVQLAGRLRCTPRLRATLGFAGTTVALAGTLRVVERLRSATLTSKVSLAGRLRCTPRLRATLGFAGTTVALAGTLRVVERLRPALLTGKVSLAGRVRVLPRLRPALLGGKVALQGTLRVVARLAGTFGAKSALAGVLRVAARLRSATLTSKVRLAGKLRCTPRLRATLGFPGATVALAGRVRVLPARLRATGIRLLYRASPVRAIVRLKGQLRKVWLPASRIRVLPRLTGVLSGVGTGGAAELRSTLRVMPARLRGLELTTTFSAAECVGAYPRLRGVLSFVNNPFVALEGRARVHPRLRPALLRSQLALRGTLRVATLRLTAVPFTGALAYLAGKLRVSGAVLRGATLTQLLVLPGKPVQSHVRLPAAKLEQRVPLTGALRSLVRTRGVLKTDRPALRGTLRVVTRMFAQARTRVAVAGLIRGVLPRATGARFAPAALTQYVVTDMSGPQLLIEEIEGPRYRIEDQSGPQYIVEDIGV